VIASATEEIRQALARSHRRSVADSSLRPAGVLLIIYAKDGEQAILLNKRTDLVEHHKGEISFPGGSKDDADESLLHTALRETHEEMGIDPGDVELLGQLDDMPTISDFLISTFVATIPYPYEFKPSEIEVAEVLEVPISHLRSEQSWRDEARFHQGALRVSRSYVYQGHVIFGATAKILANFLEVVDGAPI
jgi:8-oxo-dGTP pyrophosphatase MutT (NUDIX family)